MNSEPWVKNCIDPVNLESLSAALTLGYLQVSKSSDVIGTCLGPIKLSRYA